MPYVVTLTDDNYDFAVGFVRQVQRAQRARDHHHMDQSLSNLLSALEKASPRDVQVRQPVIIRDEASPPRSVTTTRDIATAARRCSEHPNYTAQRSPRTECSSCWNMYAEAHPERMVSRTG